MSSRHTPPASHLERILDTLGQINVNVESLRVTLTALVETAGDHERRIRSNERWRFNLTPVLAVMTFVLGAIFTVTLERYL
ncbi:MAG: hypothetical protein R3C01_07560 [Planctomycetaceae bacterium]